MGVGIKNEGKEAMKKGRTEGKKEIKEGKKEGRKEGGKDGPRMKKWKEAFIEERV